MKFFLILLLLFCNLQGMSAHQNTYKTATDIPFLSQERTISINRDDLKSMTKIDKKFINLMTDIIDATNENQLKKANQKTLLFFEDLANKNEGIDINIIANYQLGHYYAFGIFDPYFDGDRPSNIERIGLQPINKTLALKYFNRITNGFQQAKGLIQLIPNTWMFNIEQGLASASDMYYKDLAIVIKYLDDNKYYFNPKKICSQTSAYCDECETKEILPYKNVINILYAIEQLPMTSPIRKQLLPDLNSDEIASLAISYNKQNKPFEALYYGALSAIKGNANGYLILIDNWTKSFLTHYQKKHPIEYKAGLAHTTIPIILWCSEDCLKENIKNFDNINESVASYFENIGEELYEDYTAEQKAKKRARNRETWRQLGLALAGALQQTNTQLYNYYAQPNYSNMGSLNNLLDPRLAAMQVNAQEYAEYQEFCRYNKRADGSNYSYSEWTAFKGQAILNMKAQGYDPIAEQKKINEQQKADFNEQRKKDKEAWFANYGYNTTSSTTTTKSSRNFSTETETVNTNKKLKDNADLSLEKDIDSKEQYKSKGVSSDDYQFEKHVTLYIREANSNRVMFSNKELCKKGANYYVKIDNSYYLVNAQGGWGFNSSILYSHSKLFFNK